MIDFPFSRGWVWVHLHSHLPSERSEAVLPVVGMQWMLSASRKLRPLNGGFHQGAKPLNPQRRPLPSEGPRYRTRLIPIIFFFRQWPPCLPMDAHLNDTLTRELIGLKLSFNLSRHRHHLRYRYSSSRVDVWWQYILHKIKNAIVERPACVASVVFGELQFSSAEVADPGRIASLYLEVNTWLLCYQPPHRALWSYQPEARKSE